MDIWRTIFRRMAPLLSQTLTGENILPGKISGGARQMAVQEGLLEFQFWILKYSFLNLQENLKFFKDNFQITARKNRIKGNLNFSREAVTYYCSVLWWIERGLIEVQRK